MGIIAILIGGIIFVYMFKTLINSGENKKTGDPIIDNDPELASKFQAIEDDLEKLGEETDKISKEITERHKGTPLEDFFNIG